MTREIRLNAFDMACLGHIQQGMWTHPRDHAADYLSLDHWTSLARTLERGLFDGLFLADVLGVYDVHGGSQDAAVRHGVQIPLLDPMLLVPAMAAVTQNRDGKPGLGAAGVAGAALLHAGSPDRRADRLEHRHGVSGQRGAGDGAGPADGA